MALPSPGIGEQPTSRIQIIMDKVAIGEAGLECKCRAAELLTAHHAELSLAYGTWMRDHAAKLQCYAA